MEESWIAHRSSAARLGGMLAPSLSSTADRSSATHARSVRTKRPRPRRRQSTLPISRLDTNCDTDQPSNFCPVPQDFWIRSTQHLQRPCDAAGIFDKSYVAIFVQFSRWRELYAVIGWAFCASCGADGAEYCALKRTGQMYTDDTINGSTGPAAAKKRKRDKSSQVEDALPPPLKLPEIKVRAASKADC